MAFDPFNSLAPSSRTSRGSDRSPRNGRGGARIRIGLGAALVLLLAALGITVAVTAIGQVSHSLDVAAPEADPSAGAAVGLSGEPGADTAAPGVFVHVLGAVLHPGLFEVDDGARVVDVVAAAGGLLPTADESGLNLARPVSDGEQLYVPLVGETAADAPAEASGAGDGAGPSGPGAAPKVNLNTATVEDLETLPRIGPAMAQRILDYRTAQGRYSTVEDLRQVTGIGEKTFAALKDLVTV